MNRSHSERQLILLSAGTTARREDMREIAGRLIVEADWPRLAETLRQRKLLPVLGPRILAMAAGSASVGFVAAVEQALETGRRQGFFLQLISKRIMEMLADAGIRASPLKGPSLAEALYGDLGRRLSSDIDLLVAPEQLTAAVSVVRELGYGAPTDHLDASGLPLLHFTLMHEQAELPPVELHWRVHWYERSFARDRLLSPTLDPMGQWRPDPVDEITALLLFYARDGFIDVRLAVDLSAWWDVVGASLAPGALDDLVRVYPGLARVVSAALNVTEHVVGLPATQIVANKPKQSIRDRMAVRLANPNPHSSVSQLYADKGLIDGLLMPQGDLGAFMRRQLLPPREVLEERARHAQKRRARSSLSRCFGVLGRYGLTLIRMAYRPETLR